MQRNIDLMRDLLIEAVNDRYLAVLFTYHGKSSEEELLRMHHARLLTDAGLFAQTGKTYFRITNKGYDCIEATRDPVIWQAATEAATAADAMTLDVLHGVASELLREKVKAITGFEV